MNDCDSNTYNKFKPLRGASYNILTYLMKNNENLFKLLKYVGVKDNPYTKPNVPFADKVAMCARNSYDTNESTKKNILFITELREALAINVVQLRIEVDDVIGSDSYRGYMNIWFQIIVPITLEVMGNTGLTGERRTDAIFLELVETLNGANIPDSGFNSTMFINKGTTAGAGLKTGSYRQKSNTDYVSRWVCFGVRV